MPSTILVTGSAGFIGFHITKKLLQKGYSVIGIDNLNNYYDTKLKQARNAILQKNNAYTFYEGDITDTKKIEEIFRAHKIDTICHMAAQAGVRYSLENPLIYEETNNKGFLTILESARKFGVSHIVYASSSSVYGNNKMPKNGFSEDDAVNQPISLYGATKSSNELMAYVYHHLYDMQCTGLRFFTVYGPWGRPDMAYFSFADAMRKGEPINVFNNGKMKRDFTYIDDIIDGIFAAIQKPFDYEIFNLGNSHTVELMHFIACLEKNLNRKAILQFLPLQPGDLVETFADIKKAKKYLDFQPKIQIEKGIENFVSWYKNYFSV